MNHEPLTNKEKNKIKKERRPVESASLEEAIEWPALPAAREAAERLQEHLRDGQFESWFLEDNQSIVRIDEDGKIVLATSLLSKASALSGRFGNQLNDCFGKGGWRVEHMPKI